MLNDRVYIMVSIVRPYLYKLGVSNRVDLREKQVGAKSIFAVCLPWAYTIEAAMQRYLAPTNLRTWGSGASEWFVSCNPILALIFLNFQLWLDWFSYLPKYAAVVVFLLPLPLDAILILTCIAAVCYASITGLVLACIYAVLNFIL